MIHFDLQTAVALIGKFAFVETVCESDPLPELHCVQVVGVVPPLDRVIKHPHFLVMDQLDRQRFPSELFWHNIQSLKVLEPSEVDACKILIPQDCIMTC